ncbi:hypothetical protein QAD02_016769 [Eretmocerus hayati]|uniref:Uncharacterized protein n=1 Tax=Eretmocerus hayati TaxID=131215 RepID=A0ACC2PEV5_9HYME|nr:hypothetical protein QAD02_016769 [Eretmocerus hayati]
MASKVLVLSILFITCSLVTAGTSSKNVEHGHRIPGDSIVYEKIVEKKPSPLHEINLTRTFFTNGEEITAVEIIDRSGQYDSVAMVTSGGKGFPYVTVDFYSPRGQGFKYNVIIFGKGVHRARVAV